MDLSFVCCPVARDRHEGIRAEASGISVFQHTSGSSVEGQLAARPRQSRLTVFLLVTGAPSKKSFYTTKAPLRELKPHQNRTMARPFLRAIAPLSRP